MDRSERGMNRILKPTLIGVLATPVAMSLAWFSAGFGHGNYVWARVLFPYSLLLTNVTGSLTTPLIVLAVVQFPLYGVVCGVCAKKMPCLAVATLAHAVAVGATFFGAVSMLA